MKKLVLSLAVVFAVGMVSCGSNEKKDAECDSTQVETVEETAVIEEAPAADSPAAIDSPAADTAK